MLGELMSGTGQGIASIWGSDSPPKAILNRYAAKTAKNQAKISEDLSTDVNAASKAAFNTYMAGQGKQEELARDQEGVLGTLRDRRMSADPNRLLQDTGNTLFGFINPNVVNPLARFDANNDTLMRRARGMNPAAVNSTSERLRNARIASGRYYDVARDAYQALPGAVNSAYAQGISNDAAAAGYNPAIAANYNAVSERPNRGIMNRIGTSSSALSAARQGIDNVVAATQGYQTPKNAWDKIGGAIDQQGQGIAAGEAQMMSLAQSALGAMGSAEGGGGGGGGGMGAGLMSQPGARTGTGRLGGIDAGSGFGSQFAGMA
jgi:hypothetical protein